MKPLFVVVLIVAVFSAGIYLGVSGLVGKYAVAPSGSDASSSGACTPSKATVAIGEPVTFILNIADVSVFWTTTEGKMQYVQPGRLQFVYSTAGAKTAYAMAGIGPNGSYLRIPCSVSVK